MNQNSLSGLTGPSRHPVQGCGSLTLGTVLDAVNSNDQTLRRAQAEHLRLLDRARVAALAEVDGGFPGDLNPAHATASAKLVLERGFALRSLVAELATMLHLPEVTIISQLYEAQHLSEQLPATLAALHTGSISLAHVREITREAIAVTPETVSLFEEAALPLAARLTVARFRLALRRLSESMNPTAIAERIHRNRSERRVHIEADRDGMAWLHLYLPVEHVAAIAARLDAMAQNLAQLQTSNTTHGPNTESGAEAGSGADAGADAGSGADAGAGAELVHRTRAQIEADIAADLLEHGQIGAGGTSRSATCTDGVAPVRPVVYLTVPALTLTGAGTNPGELDGFGPIDPDTARRLTAGAPSFQRILTHPETGAYLSYGREHYRVPADLKGYLQLRDQHCRFPGCSRAAQHCDIDHTTDWQHGGPTSHTNLAHLCRTHHRLKHHSQWKPQHLNDGTLRWTSPHGRTHDSTPAVTFATTTPTTSDTHITSDTPQDTLSATPGDATSAAMYRSTVNHAWPPDLPPLAGDPPPF